MTVVATSAEKAVTTAKEAVAAKGAKAVTEATMAEKEMDLQVVASVTSLANAVKTVANVEEDFKV